MVNFKAIKMKILENPDKLDFRDEIFYELAYYENNPFTGILKTEFEEVKFENGFTIYKVKFHKNGIKASEEFFKGGIETKSSSWFEDGSIEHELTLDHSFFNEPGRALGTGFSLYPNGKLKSKTENGTSKSYSENGVLIVESKWTPDDNYLKVYYLNENLKYWNLPNSKQSSHYTDKGQLIIEEDLTYGKKYTKYNDEIIEENIRTLFTSEKKGNASSEQADRIRYNRLLTWLVNKIQIENLPKYIKLNFELCFCEDEAQAEYAFKRLVGKLDKQQIIDFNPSPILGIEKEELLRKLERLKVEINKK